MEIFFAERVEGRMCFLDSGESLHCVKVLRHREGDEINVSDGCGTLMHCRLTDASPAGAAAVVLSEEKEWGAHPYRLEVAVCPTKNMDRYEWFAEKVTEIGVDVISPVIGDRSERRVMKTDRLRKIVFSAAKQSLKGRIPEVREPVRVRDFISSANPDSLRLIAYCLDDESRRVSVKEAVGKWEGKDITVLIGPEGDFSPEEVESAISAGFVPVHLGPSRLRTETAALVAVEAVYNMYCM